MSQRICRHATCHCLSACAEASQSEVQCIGTCEIIPARSSLGQSSALGKLQATCRITTPTWRPEAAHCWQDACSPRDLSLERQLPSYPPTLACWEGCRDGAESIATIQNSPPSGARVGNAWLAWMSGLLLLWFVWCKDCLIH